MNTLSTRSVLFYAFLVVCLLVAYNNGQQHSPPSNVTGEPELPEGSSRTDGGYPA